ncbi:ribosomal protein L4 [Mycoplasma haemofelis str. Langford 1]|uniref:Large ribosomal subunit protein uL4 n=2 Tax=Mycoplasma haemofelis TaxID=29501 RepID=F6FHD4_MYCHI|nr:50S ribosomal protein L4 [Mycoplasma haemofelis]AEG73764.1 50S ribosomal protein L4 [Mycoplasma haemofelis Ohio2]CBY93469.1 ribosomal protein L4 [Mycoplasma haemofelis str. Langford 1]
MKPISIFSASGDIKGSFELPASIILPDEIHSHAIFEAVNCENQNRRQGTHDTKNKSEVSGTGKKPYRQKHTGRARQGSRRNPQFRGGGVAFGPSPMRNYVVGVNRKVSRLAFASAWKGIFESENIALLDESFSSLKKTKEFQEFLGKAKLDSKKLLLLDKESASSVFLVSRNLSNVTCRDFFHCSVRDLMNQSFLLLTKEAMDLLCERLGSWK